MNRSAFKTLFNVATIFVLVSCGSNEQKTESSSTDTTATTTDANTTATTTASSTIVTTPQNMMVVTSRVANFAKWKASYDAHDTARLASGIHNYVIARGIQDTNMIMVAVKVDDVTKAKAFAKSPSLKQAMQKGGVIGTPDIQFNTMVFQDTATLSNVLRSRTTFTVKDFEAWRKVFESHRQTRTDNGLTDRAYGHDVDDDHKVTLVVAVNDTAKAQAFWKSDLLKQQRAESGVTSEPKRFLYTVVQRY